MLLGTSFVLLSLVPATAQDGGAWPRWRGPRGDGISLERDWNPAGRAEPLWSAEVGLGYSNVVIGGGRLYTVGHDADAQEDRIVCLDAQTGKELWRHAFAADTMANYHGGGALGTPTLDGDLLFAVGRRGRVHCLEAASGKLRWERDCASELAIEVPEYGFAPAPVVIGDTLYLALGPTFAALARADGALRWRKDELGASGYATPAPFEHAGRTCLAVFAGVGLVVLDAGSGEERCRFPLEGDQGATVNATTPIVDDGRVFVSSAYGAGAALVRLGDGPEPEVVWRNKLMRNKVASSVLWQGHVYGFDESILKCIRLADGVEQWRARGLGMGAVGLAGGRLLVLSSRGELVVADADPQAFNELSRKKVLDGGVYWTAPVLLDGRIYCRNSLGQIVCLDHRGSAAPVTAGAAGAAAGSALPEAAGLLARHAELSGAARIAERGSAHMQGWIENPGAGLVRAPLTIDWIAPNRWRRMYSLEGFGETVHCHDGELAWRLDVWIGNGLLEGEELAELAFMADLAAPARWAAEPAGTRTVGRERLGDVDCFVVRLEREGQTPRQLYFDAASGLLAGRDAPSGDFVTWSEWRDFDGVKLPARTIVVSGATGEEETLIVESVEWGRVDPAVFERPAEVLALLRTPEQIAADEARLRERHAAILGKYEMQEGPFAGAVHAVDVQGGALVVAIPGMRAFPLAEPDPEQRYYFPPTSIYVTFERDAEGKATVMVMHDAPGSPPEVRLPRLP